MSGAAKSKALKSLMSDANAARLGKRLPKGERSKLLGLIKEELDEDEEEESDDSDEE